MTDSSRRRPAKESWVENQLRLRESEFADTRDIKVFCGTWNVNGKLVSEDISPWLLAHRTDGVEPGGTTAARVVGLGAADPDIFVVGVQELDTSAEAFLLNDSPREDYWTVAMENGLKERAGHYVKVQSRQLVGMLIVVYVRRELVAHVRDVSSSSAGCGIMGMMGNKGGVAVRLRLFDSWMCFVNCHLAADTKEVDRRNQDFQEICRRLSFPASGGSVGGMKPATVWDCDVLIWCGDLNYRIPLPEVEAKELLKSLPVSSLLAHDQLNVERHHKRAFADFEEGIITFPPTYKYDPGTNTFDSSEKRRTPSWCDRVLWRKSDPVSILSYRSCMALTVSDHKPVSAVLRVAVKTVNQAKLSVVHQSVLRELDKFENETMPDATVSANHLNFTNVRHAVAQTQSITLENTGQVIAQFRFIPKLDDKNVCRPWLWVNPPMSMLLPGDKIQVNFTVLVDNAVAAALNAGHEKLEDILILHLENGKDYFVSVSGTFVPTCFAVPLAVLVNHVQPIRPVHKLPVGAAAPSLSIPKELWRIVDYLFHFGLGVENLFLTSGDVVTMERIKEALDVGSDFAVESQSFLDNDRADFLSAQEKQLRFVHSMAEILVRFLEALPEPIVPFAQYQRCIDSYQTYELAKQVVASLPPVHSNAFVYLTSFLREILSTYTSSYEDRKEKLAMVFASVILRPPKVVADKYVEVVNKKKTAFMLHFLNVGASDLVLQT